MEETLIQRNPFANTAFFEFRRFDGTGNNLAPNLRNLGSVDTLYRRIAPVEYEDGLAAPAGVAPPDGTRNPIFLEDGTVLDNPPNRPSPREVSNVIFNQTEASIPNGRSLTDLVWSFGQFVNHDTSFAKPGETDFPIPVPEDDPVLQQDTLPFQRDAFAPGTGTPVTNVPAEGVNTVTAWLDLSTIYGAEPSFDLDLQSFDRLAPGGKLAVLSTETGNILTADETDRAIDGAFEGVGFRSGDARVNTNSSLVTQHTLWTRNHNRLADRLSETHPDWTDEQLFQRARQLNIAQYQNVALYEWLPLIVGEDYIDPYESYDAAIDPQITNTFSVAASQIILTQIGSEILRFDANGMPVADGNINILQDFGAPNITDGEDLNQILRGLSARVAEAIDNQVVGELRNRIPEPAIPEGIDLVAHTIQRGRDRGLSDYNQLRANLNEIAPELGIQPLGSFAGITSEPQTQQALQDLYNTIADIDMWVGLLSEDPVGDPSLPTASLLGPTARGVLKLQFERLRDGDRFWFENAIGEDGGDSGVFAPAEIEAIRQTTFGEILRLNTDIDNIQPDPFTLVTTATEGNDTLFGSFGDDTFFALFGNDRYNANSGDDLVFGNKGNDTLDGGLGNDTIYGGMDNDSIVGTSGNNFLFGDLGNDFIQAGTGSDFLEGNDGNDTLNAGSGSDTLLGGAGFDFLDGGSGSDYLSGSMGNNTLLGGEGDNTLLSGNGVDVLISGSGSDYLFVEGGNNTLNGGGGNDTLLAGDGLDLLIGGSGSDYLSGSMGNNMLIGGEGDNTLLSGDGVDSLIAGSGSDYLLSGLGNDTLVGGDGNNSLFGGGNDDRLFGSSGNDFFSGDLGFDTLESGLGNDTLFGGDNEDRLFSGGGDDFLFGEGGNDFLVAGSDADVLVGGEGFDTLFGNTGNDRLFGNQGNDFLDGGTDSSVIFGGRGDDTVITGDGDDTLAGDRGNDQLLAGSGADSFLFGAPGVEFAELGLDFAPGFGTDGDRVLLSQSTFTALNNFNASQFRLVDSQADAQASGGLIIYDRSSGALFYNPDGATPGLTGGGQFVQLEAGLELSTDNVVVF